MASKKPVKVTALKKKPAKVEESEEIAEETAAAEEQDASSVRSSVQLVNPFSIERHTGEFDESKMKLMVYAESGTGKTRFAATFPNAIFIDTDHGMSSVDWEVDRVNITNFHQVEEALQYLQTEDHGYETVIIDTLNELQTFAMQATVSDFPHIRRSYDDLPSMADYGKMLHDFMEITKSFIALPMRVILVAQVTSRTYEGEVLLPQLTGKSTARELARKMDVIGYMYNTLNDQEEIVPAITFQSAEYVTKDRSNKLPNFLLQPTYEGMLEYL